MRKYGHGHDKPGKKHKHFRPGNKQGRSFKSDKNYTPGKRPKLTSEQAHAMQGRRMVGDFAQRIQNAYRERDARKLKKIIDMCVNEMAMEFNNDVFLLALISFMLTKMLTKPRFWSSPSIKKYIRQIDSTFAQILKGSAAGNEDAVSGGLHEILRLVDSLDAEDKRHVNTLIEGGKIKIASTMYAKGVSLGRVSELTGVSKQEILHYSGGTMMADRIPSAVSLQERLKRMRKAGV